ncbi:MAG: type VI immunity family protein [Cystobacter sp.]
MSDSIPRIRLYSSQSGKPRLVGREVIRLTVYLPFDHHDLSAPVRGALDLYLSHLQQGPEVLSDWYDFETEPFPLDDDNWDIIRAMLAPPQGKRFLDDVDDPREVQRYAKSQFERAVELSGGEAGISGYGFFYGSRLPWKDPRDTVSQVSFSWPTEYLREHGPERMRELILELASPLPFSSGHAGLAVASAFSSPAFEDIREQALRHPGLDVTRGHTSLGRGLDGVHWLNLLGQPVLGEVGGTEVLRARLGSPDTRVHELEGGRAWVSLGSGPEGGDMSRGDFLPGYREWARILAPWLSPCPGLKGASLEESRSWWHRFLDP